MFTVQTAQKEKKKGFLVWKIYFLPVSSVQCCSKICRRTESSFVATAVDFKWFPFMLLFFISLPSPSLWQPRHYYCSSVCRTSNSAGFTRWVFNTVRHGGRVWSGADALTGREQRHLEGEATSHPHSPLYKCDYSTPLAFSEKFGNRIHSLTPSHLEARHSLSPQCSRGIKNVKKRYQCFSFEEKKISPKTFEQCYNIMWLPPCSCSCNVFQICFGACSEFCIRADPQLGIILSGCLTALTTGRVCVCARV